MSWSKHPDFDYEVSDMGVVRSLPRVVLRSNGKPYTVRPKELRPSMRGGHLGVVLSQGGTYYSRYVHRLVLEAHVGPCPPGMEGLHEDDDPSNNSLENLRWATRSENMFDRVNNGIHFQANKTHCKRGHLLDGPNLCDWWKVRNCLACARAKMVARYHDRGKDEEFVGQLADEKYASIMV